MKQTNLPTYLPRCRLAGGDRGPGGEQVPERGVPPVHLRALGGGVGQAGPVGHHPQGALGQRALDYTAAPPLVSNDDNNNNNNHGHLSRPLSGESGALTVQYKLNTRTHTHVHRHTHRQRHTRTHTYTYTYTHTHI